VIASISEPREVLSMSRAELAVRQTALVAALVAGAEAPEGIDAGHLAVARRALLHKRAGEVAVVWPLLAASVGHDWTATFAEWATGRPPQGSLRDGWDPARDLATGGSWERWVRWNSPPGRPPHATTGAQHPDDVGFPRCVEFRVGSSFSWLAEYVGWHHVTGSGPHHRTDTPRLKRLPGWGRDARGNTTPRRDPAIPCRRRNE
jgi:hypothetical protein